MGYIQERVGSRYDPPPMSVDAMVWHAWMGKGVGGGGAGGSYTWSPHNLTSIKVHDIFISAVYFLNWDVFLFVCFWQVNDGQCEQKLHDSTWYEIAQECFQWSKENACLRNYMNTSCSCNILFSCTIQKRKNKKNKQKQNILSGDCISEWNGLFKTAQLFTHLQTAFCFIFIFLMRNSGRAVTTLVGFVHVMHVW